MKRFLLIALMAITAVALVAAPGWAAGGRKLSDRQLDNVHAGTSGPAVEDFSTAQGNASALHSGALFVAGAASSAAASVASDVGSALAVKINNKCNSGSGDCELKIFSEVENNGESTGGDNAQSILNTVGSVNAVQINVAASEGDQKNIAYSAEGAIGGVVGDAHAFADADAGVVQTTNFASADSAASSAASAAGVIGFVTPRVEIKNRCGAAAECKLKIFSDIENEGGSSTTTNAQSIVNTVASVNAVQINVASGGGSQTNIAYSTYGAHLASGQ